MSRVPESSARRRLMGGRRSVARVGAGAAVAALLVAVAPTVGPAAAAPTAIRPVAIAATATGTGRVFQAADAVFGIRSSASVRNLQRRLIRTGFATSGLLRIGASGNYGKATRASVARVQRSLGFTGSGADGILGRASAVRLGLTWVTSGTATVGQVTTPTPSTSGALSATALRAVLAEAGFGEPAIRTAWAIAMRESGGYPGIIGPVNSNGTRDYGLFQINDVHRSHIDFATILDPLANARAAYQLSSGGTDFGAWGIGDTGWAGQIHKSNPTLWKQWQDGLKVWVAQYPG